MPNRKRSRRTRTQCVGAVLRIILFIANGVVWGAALAALLGGILVGFSNGTFTMDAPEDDRYAEGDIRWRDILLTTPATLLVYYGIMMILVTTVGCFAAAGAQRCCNITYIISIVLLFIFDIVFGIRAFFDKWAMQKFINRMDSAMDQYGTNKSTKIGVLPMDPTDYWDYLQRVGSCCGILKYQDWKNKTIGNAQHDFSIPDSCCNKDYDYQNCGWRVWAHYDGDYNHYRRDMLKRIGCISIFPTELTTEYDEVAYITIFLGVLLIINFIVAIVLLVFIFLRRYKGYQGPEQHPFSKRKPDEADLPEVWHRRGRRESSRLPLPAEDQNYRVNDPVFFTQDQLRDDRQRQGRERDNFGPDGFHHDEPAPERLPFSPRTKNTTATETQPQPTRLAKARQLYSPSAEKIFYNKDFAGPGAVTSQIVRDEPENTRPRTTVTPIMKPMVKKVRSA